MSWNVLTLLYHSNYCLRLLFENNLWLVTSHISEFNSAEVWESLEILHRAFRDLSYAWVWTWTLVPHYFHLMSIRDSSALCSVHKRFCFVPQWSRDAQGEIWAARSPADVHDNDQRRGSKWEKISLGWAWDKWWVLIYFIVCTGHVNKGSAIRQYHDIDKNISMIIIVTQCN